MDCDPRCWARRCACLLLICPLVFASPLLPAQTRLPRVDASPASPHAMGGPGAPSDFTTVGYQQQPFQNNSRQGLPHAGQPPHTLMPAVRFADPRADGPQLRPPAVPREIAVSQPPVPGENQVTELAERLRRLEETQTRLQGLVDELDTQGSPGARYVQPPSYFYQSGYYDSGLGGARPLADYAPPGYMPREQQEGPSVPEFTPLTPPAQISEADRGRLVAGGMYPGSFLAPGTNTSVRLRGFVRLAALYDLDPIGLRDAFVTNTIPVPQEVGQNFNMSGRISRFALETWTPTTFHDWTVHTFIEGDFFNGASQAAGGGGNPFRLRHAYFDFGYFRFGQQNSVFMDASSWPSLVDFQGPNSWVNQRQPSARVTIPLSDRLYWAASVERCFSDITTSGLGAGVQDVPDLATHLRFEADRGHVQVSGLFRRIGYRPTGGDVEQHTARAISGSAVFHPWAILMGTDPVHDPCPDGLTRSRILMQGTMGAGVGRYLNDLAGQGFDAQVNPLTGAFELVDATGWNASYEQWFNDYWLANFTYARVNVDNNADQPGSTYDSASYWAASLWWIPVPRLSFAVEFIAGDRNDFDGQVGRAQRVHGLAQYVF